MSPDPLNVDTLLDESQWSFRRLLLIVLISFALVLDAFDNQLLGLAALSIQEEFTIGKDVLSFIFAAGLVGVSLGAIVAGRLGDVIGRKKVLLFCIVLFATPSVFIAFASEVTHLMVLRFVAGLGLGGFMPVALTMVAEFSPARWRSMAVMIAVACIPIGGMAAGAVTAAWMESVGWRALFVIGGTAPLLFSLVLLVVLPESPKFLAGKAAAADKIRRALSRLNVHVPPGSTFTMNVVETGKHRISELFRHPLNRETIPLCIAFFFSLLNGYSNQSWLPSTLGLMGMGVADRGVASAISSSGGLVGILFGAVVIMKFGSRRPLIVFSVASIACAVALTQAETLFPEYRGTVFVLLALQSGSMGLIQAALFSLAAHIFPASLRSTGMGVTSGIGRFGAVASSFTAAAALQIGGSDGFFIAIASATFVVLCALIAVRTHVPKA